MSELFPEKEDMKVLEDIIVTLTTGHGTELDQTLAQLPPDALSKAFVKGMAEAASCMHYDWEPQEVFDSLRQSETFLVALKYSFLSGYSSEKGWIAQDMPPKFSFAAARAINAAFGLPTMHPSFVPVAAALQSVSFFGAETALKEGKKR